MAWWPENMSEAAGTGEHIAGCIPKDEVYPVMEIGRHIGALQSCAVGLQEMGRAICPVWQLHITHKLPILALAQCQVMDVHQKAAHNTVSMSLFRCLVHA